MHSPVHRHLMEDHGRLDAHLARSVADPVGVDLGELRCFRAGLLRHIGIEEKILLPTARRLRGGEPLSVARRLNLDHASLATLLVATPTRPIVAAIRRILVAHNPLEEDEGGMYDQVDGLLTPAQAEGILARVRATPDPRPPGRALQRQPPGARPDCTHPPGSPRNGVAGMAGG